MDDLKNEFWGRMKDVRTAMLGIQNAGKMVAMSPTVDDDFPGKIWFITAKGTDLATGTDQGPQPARMVVCNDGAGLYADVEGHLSRSHDREALEDAWSFVADAWFEGGKHDPDVCLLCFTPVAADLSITSTSAIKFFYEIAKAQISGKQPDAGRQGKVTF